MQAVPHARSNFSLVALFHRGNESIQTVLQVPFFNYTNTLPDAWFLIKMKSKSIYIMMTTLDRFFEILPVSQKKFTMTNPQIL